MYIIDGIAYAGDMKPAIKVAGIKPLSDYMIRVRFNTGEMKIFDFKPLLSKPAYSSLNDEEVFRGVYLDYGVPVWDEGETDIAPEYLYEHGVGCPAGK